VLRFVAGTLPPPEAAAALAHMDGCPACLDLVLSAASAAGLAAGPALPAAAPRPPRQIDEFLLLRPLGRGASGQVYVAQDTRLLRRVASKLLHDGGNRDTGARERFLTEARALARLSHPNVVAVHRIGEWGGGPYLVTELLRGPDLSTLPKPLPAARALALALDLGRGLTAAHQAGILHRDIKPANAILTQDGVKLVDFGLAKLGQRGPGPGLALGPGEDESLAAALPEEGLSATAPGALLGTPLYMAPELWRGQPATQRSDVYALGALLHELCTGAPPHRAATLAELARAAQEQDPPALAKGDPTGLGAVIDRCLRRDPMMRPASAAEVLRALEALSSRRPTSRRRAIVLAGAGPAVLAAGVGVGALVWHRGPPRVQRIAVPGATFAMGSEPREIRAAYAFCQRLGVRCAESIYQREGPVRQVTVSPFALDRTEVENGHFAAWLARNPRVIIDKRRLVLEDGALLVDLYPGTEYSGLTLRGGRVEVRAGFGDKPVVQVTWEGAARYCRDQGGRLPTEAEWELAARGPEGARFPWGDEPPRCEGVVFGRVADKACPGQVPGPAAVGSAPQDVTALGLRDLGGNVAEWVQDAFLPRYPPCPGPCKDPLVRPEDVVAGASNGGEPSLRVVRGGAWYRAAEAARSAGRGRARWDQVQGDIGFRCAYAGKP
jgi:formylglycine-generating enzyme required for sulfatase activity